MHARSSLLLLAVACGPVVSGPASPIADTGRTPPGYDVACA